MRLKSHLGFGVALCALHTGSAVAQTLPGNTAPPAAPATAGDQTTAQSAPGTVNPAPTATGGEIVVTGFRRSLASATAAKRNAVNVSDGISAEDIGKFPDQNLAESLQRVTGVQITRNKGEGGTISVRGLSPDFVRVNYNGRILTSSQGSRSFDFTTLSAEFVSAVQVEKTPTADMIEGGLSATVDVRTARPFEIGHSTITAAAEGLYEDLPGVVTPRLAVLGNYVNADKTFGVNAGISYEKRRPLSVAYNGFGAETSAETAKVPPVDYNHDGQLGGTYSFDHAQQYYAQPTTRERLTAIGGFQWKPTSNVELYGDAFFSHLKDNYIQYDAQSRFTSIAPAAAGQPSGVVGSTVDTSFNNQLLGGSQGFLTTVDAQGVDYRADTAFVPRRVSTKSGALGAKARFGRLSVDTAVTYSRSDSHSEFNEASIISRASVQTSRADGLGNLPAVTFTQGYDPLDPSSYNFLSYSNFSQSDSDQNIDGQLNLKYDVGSGFIRDVRVGAYGADRHAIEKVYTGTIDAQQLAALSGGKLAYNPAVEGGSVPAGSFLSPTSFGGNIPGFPSSFLVADYGKLFGLVSRSAFDQAAAPILQPASNFDIDERTYAGYLRVDFATVGDRLAGNVGVRYVDTHLTSNGFASDLDGIVIEPGGINTIVPAAGPVSIRNHYHYFLPSLNVKYDLTEHLVARFAAARVLARPAFNQLGAGLSVSSNVLTINAENPNLKPYLSNQLDLSFEYYLPHSGLVSAAFFYKHVQNFIINGQTVETHTASFANNSGTQELTFRRNEPINLATVNLKGVELAAQLPLWFLPQPLDGFGLFGNGTYVDAPKVPAEENGLPFPLPGVSKFSYTVGGYYEKGKFGIRAAYNWRGDYDTGVQNFFGDRDIELSYGQLDGSISYQLTKQISMQVDIENVTNSERRQVNNFGLARFLEDVGRRVTFGVHARF